MGNSNSGLDKKKKKKNTRLRRVIMTGIDGAGKTTILYRTNKNIVTTIPTIGFNVETSTVAGVEFTVWDCGGKDKIYPLWRHYYQDLDALIFVVDSNDRERIDQLDYMGKSAHTELYEHFLTDPLLKDVVVCIIANKQDLPNAMSVDEIQDRMGMTQNRSYEINKQLKELGNDKDNGCLLNMLTEGLITIIATYIPSRRCGPNYKNWKMTPRFFDQKGLLTNRDNLFYEGEENTLYGNLRNPSFKIRVIICEYLPPIEIDCWGTQKICKTFGTCARTGDGLMEAFEWVYHQIGVEKKQCILL